MKAFLINISFFFVYSGYAQLSVDWYKNSGALDIYNSKKSIYNPVDSCIYTSGVFSGQFEFDGASISTSFPKAFFLMKTRKDGTIVWMKTIAENDYNSEMLSIVALSANSSGALLLGITYNRKLFYGSDSTILPDDSFTTGGMLFKLDTAGVDLWHKQVFAYSIQSIASNGNNDVFLTGRTAENNDVYLSAYSETGDSLWTRTGGSTSGYDEGKQIQVDENGNIYLVGFIEPNGGVYFETSHPTFVSPYFWGSFLAKYDPSGQIQWIRCFYSSDFGDYVVSQSIAVIGNRVMVVGTFKGGIIKFYPGAAALTAPNTILTTSFILCYDADGNLVWKKKPHKSSYGDVGVDIGISADHFLLCKSSFNYDVIIGSDTIISLGSNEIFLEKLDTLGNSIWHQQIKGTNSDGAASFFKAGDDLILNISTKSQSLLVDNTTMTLAPVSDQMVLVRFNYETLGLSEDKSEDFAVFPNPNNGTWSLQSANDLSGKRVQIFSVSGELISEQLLTNGTINVIATLLSGGVYLLRIEDSEAKPIRIVIK